HSRPAMFRNARAHLADWAESKDGDTASVRNVRELDGLPGRRQHVGEEQEPLVGRAFRNFDWSEVRLRHAQVFRLPAGHLTVQLRISEQRATGLLLTHLGCFALSKQLLLAHPAASARDV